jgi:hypothetical protein
LGGTAVDLDLLGLDMNLSNAKIGQLLIPVDTR